MQASQGMSHMPWRWPSQFPFIWEMLIPCDHVMDPEQDRPGM